MSSIRGKSTILSCGRSLNVKNIQGNLDFGMKFLPNTLKTLQNFSLSWKSGHKIFQELFKPVILCIFHSQHFWDPFHIH